MSECARWAVSSFMPACKVPATVTAQEQNAMKAAQKPPKRGSKAKGASKARPKAKAASKARAKPKAKAAAIKSKGGKNSAASSASGRGSRGRGGRGRGKAGHGSSKPAATVKGRGRGRGTGRGRGRGRLEEASVPDDGEAPRILGCPRCRFAAKGCLTCRDPSYRYRGSRGRPASAPA